MKKKFAASILVVLTALSLWACGSKGTEVENSVSDTKSPAKTDTAAEAESNTDLSADTPEASSAPESTEASASDTAPKAESFSFADLKNLQFTFSSGAGGWANQLMIRGNGSFSGQYFDVEMGATGDNYPNGTMYQCNFSGQLAPPTKVNAYTYSTRIQEITYEQEPGSEEIRDGVLYCYTDAYGLDNAQDILIYLPGAPLSELSEDFRSWIGHNQPSKQAEEGLPFYALNNEAQQYGFSGWDIVAQARETVTSAEQWAASVEKELLTESLTQGDMNVKSLELYQTWDSTLNLVWNVLKQTQDAETMEALTEEERAWITRKEQEAQDAGAEARGGSLEPLLVNTKAAELTRERVYELLELLE